MPNWTKEAGSDDLVSTFYILVMKQFSIKSGGHSVIYFVLEVGINNFGLVCEYPNFVGYLLKTYWRCCMLVLIEDMKKLY